MGNWFLFTPISGVMSPLLLTGRGPRCRTKRPASPFDSDLIYDSRFFLNGLRTGPSFSWKRWPQVYQESIWISLKLDGWNPANQLRLVVKGFINLFIQPVVVRGYHSTWMMSMFWAPQKVWPGCPDAIVTTRLPWNSFRWPGIRKNCKSSFVTSPKT